MSETADTPAIEAVCAQCGRALPPEDQVAAGDRLFCRTCYAALRSELEHAITDMSSNVNYANASLGAVLGGVAGALLWWGFTAITHVALGLLAIAIGFLTGIGAVKFSGGKRSTGLQAISVATSLASYVLATYLVNMTFINKALAERGAEGRVQFPPQNAELFYSVVSADLGIMDAVFLAIVIYQAWKIPRPVAMPPAAA